MWPWKNKALDDGDRLATLSRRLDDVESKARMLSTEWQDTLDRMERILGRLNKRASRDAGAPEPTDAPNGEAAPPTSPAAALVALRRSRPAGGPAGRR